MDGMGDGMVDAYHARYLPVGHGLLAEFRDIKSVLLGMPDVATTFTNDVKLWRGVASESLEL
jgi:hypothetical protein